MSKSREKIGVQFYPLTAEEIKQWYRDKLLTTAGYLLAIKKITKLPGSNLVIPNVLKFCREWEISKSAFYRAVNELRQKGYTDWEATHGIILKETQKVVAFPSEEKEEKCPTDGTVSHERDDMSHERDGESHERDDVSHERDSVSHERENRSPKLAPDKNSSTPQIYTELIQTLSEGERENFLKFAKKKASQLPKPPELPFRWIEAHFEELHEQWLETQNKKENQNTIYSFDKYTEAQHQMWYGQLQIVVEAVNQCGSDTSLRRFFVDDFYKCWFNWAKSAREDVRSLIANNPILEKNYG
ncbi:hypothetical protein [Rivularia sp. UHCC 0363]|uniref:hypothetical protein n=1 Tax=Rivularia sp. UHCC 0363 TaxID=3110244 RepID=UPI002B205C06|nr:hypothetical protein [Rivularia sp. UHCC 0363]MEA5595724.1 hypothetical protein [Rivularia sp. UHCC 0363]